ncbi:MAG: tetratricopeptide repeat protein [Deltaproteobacteria bacterium]|nr:tetratricopeptide repeat protein [Deltaproteobacteria bacterium]
MDEEFLRRLAAVVTANTGIHLDPVEPGSATAFTNALEAGMKAKGVSTPAAYLRLIEAGGEEAWAVLSELAGRLIVEESYFFRDRGQFELLRSRLLPELMARRSGEKRLRIWSAGCSTGEEPYSVAIVLSEFGQGLAGWDVSIIGTDFRPDLLARARLGVYGDWALRAAPQPVRENYFRKDPGGYALDERINRMVAFERCDLVRDEFPDAGKGIHDVDLIICRNVFIYYERKTVAEVVGKFEKTMRPGGFLMTGHGELYGAAQGGLRPRLFPESVVYEKARPEAAAAPRPWPLAAKKVSAARPAAVKPSKPEAALSLDDIEAMIRAGAYKEAEEALRRIPADGADCRALCLLGEALASMGRLAEAASALRKAESINRLSPAPHYVLAQIALEQGRFREAVESLEKVIYLDPDRIAAYLELASIHEGLGEDEPARRMRKAGLALLNRLTPDAAVPPYEGMTAGDIREAVSRML